MATERCPLIFDQELGAREGWPLDIPETCLRQCVDLMTEATTQVGAWDDYLHGEPIPNGDVEFSHDAVGIVSLGNLAARFYTVVDRVTTEHDWLEIGETTYSFDCPHSET